MAKLYAVLFVALGVHLFAETQQSEDALKANFKTATELMAKGQHKEALPYLKMVQQGLPDYPNVLWNLGIAFSETGDHREALSVWQKYLKVEPDDWRAMAKCVQACQAIGDIEARNREIAALRASREKLTGAERKKAERFCREQCVIANRRVFAFEYFNPQGPRRQYFRFSVVDKEGKEEFYISLGSYDETNAIAHELGEVTKDQRLYHLDQYNKAQHRTYAFYHEKPDYDAVRASVVAILEGKLEAVSGSERAAPSPK